MMRRILVDAARKRSASRHGGGLGRIQLDDVAHLDLSHENDKQLIALNDALDELANGDPRKGESCGIAILWRVERTGNSCLPQGVGGECASSLAKLRGRIRERCLP